MSGRRAPGAVATRYWCELALVGEPSAGRVERDVVITLDSDRISEVTAGVARRSAPDAQLLKGVTIPGLANAHSHAFHRALRATTEQGGGDFWTWRREMYDVADRLDPDSYLRLARALFAEMTLAGMTSVGEFHYLHHDADGVAYADPNEMGRAVVAAASSAGIRLTLLDTCYLSAGFGDPLEGVQLRFSDGSVDAWVERFALLQPTAACKLGAGVHSVRALDAPSIEAVATTASALEVPLHFHLSEQRAENEGCVAVHGCTPAELLAARGALGPTSTAVHATHLTATDVGLLGSSATAICCCPTTERDLGDGVTAARLLARAGSPLCVGSDSQTIVDAFEEARSIELHERLVSERRGRHTPASLLAAATADGHRAIGWHEAGRIAPGALADFTTVSLDSLRLCGTEPTGVVAALVFAAGAPDVSDVVIGGRRVVKGFEHQLVDEPAREMAEALAQVGLRGRA